MLGGNLGSLLYGDVSVMWLENPENRFSLHGAQILTGSVIVCVVILILFFSESK